MLEFNKALRNSNAVNFLIIDLEKCKKKKQNYNTPSRSYWDNVDRVDTAFGSTAGSVSSSILKSCIEKIN